MSGSNVAMILDPDSEADHGDAMTDPLRAALQRAFGFDDFHLSQRAVIEDVLAGRPTVAVMPTGAGKSLCYQLPALLLPGVTLVISPLISLMKDQVDTLKARGIAADLLNSTQTLDEQQAVLARLASGDTRLIYVAPERFRHGAFLRALSRVNLALMAVDEAHCISRWGHDFRPDYMRLGGVVRALKPPRLLACTATATVEVREDITRTLDMDEPEVHVSGFLRTNLYLEARLCSGDRDRLERIVDFVQTGPGREGAVIVYCSTRKRVERFSMELWKRLGDHMVVPYHGGMDDASRSEAQERFMSGSARVAVATNAFGMGVDRSDVRAVVHADLPRTVEGYYQEVGRAGRDRKPAHCLLLFNPNDTRVHEFLIDQSNPGPRVVERVWQRVRNLTRDGALPMHVVEQAMPDNMRGAGFEASLRFLSRVDAVGRDADGGVWANFEVPDDLEALGLDFGAMRAHRGAELDRLKRMKHLAYEAPCRHRAILDYFGEAYSGECPGCDKCHPAQSTVPNANDDEPPTEEEILLVRKALAGVARAEGRFGMKKVAAMLAGSKARTISGTSLVRLSTYGLLKSLGQEGVGELLRTLIEQGLCRFEGSEYPKIVATREGWAVMQGQDEPAFRLPLKLRPLPPPSARPKAGAARAAGGPITSDEVDPRRVTLLKAFRSEEARRDSVPPYVVFNDRTLAQIAALSPQDETSFLAVPGLGPAKWKRYGERLLAVVALWMATGEA